MRAFFKDNNKIIINSLDHSEALVGKTFMSLVANSNVLIEQRYDINDEFDGLVISLTEKEIIPLTPLNIFPEVELVNDGTDFSLNFKYSECILFDYDETKVNVFIKFLEGLGYTEVAWDITKGFTAKGTGEVNPTEYTFPEGTFKFHKPLSNLDFTNTSFNVSLINTVLEGGD